jgi:DNA-binding transcriptional MerR regulator
VKKTRSTEAAEISSGELCDLLAISPQTLTRLHNEGAITPTHRGHWPLRATVQGYVAHIRDVAKRRRSGFEESKAREKAAKARLAEAAADREEKKLLTLDEVSAAESSILTALVTRLCNFGDGIAGVCHEQPGDFIAARVNGGLRSALREVANLPHVPADEKKKTLQRLGFAS